MQPCKQILRLHKANPPTMFKNYLKTAVRIMLRQKAYSAINVIGLSMGIAATLIILIYVIDELGYVPLAEVGAELLFQVIADRAERMAVIVTTNLPFSEWPQVFPNARLCKAMLDRLTDRAHIVETGTESFRFRRTVAGRRGVRDASAAVSEGWPSASP